MLLTEKKALELTEASEENTGLEVEETIGDCAYGDGGTRQEFADANRTLVAKVAAYGHGEQISKGAFRIDLDEMTCTCPADQTTSTLVGRGYREDHAGKKEGVEKEAAAMGERGGGGVGRFAPPSPPPPAFLVQ